MTIEAEDAFKTLFKSAENLRSALDEYEYLTCMLIMFEPGLFFGVWHREDTDSSTACAVEIKDGKISIKDAGSYLSESEWILTVFLETLGGERG